MRSRSTSGPATITVQTQGGKQLTNADEKLERVLDLLSRPQLTADRAKEIRLALKSADKKWLLLFLQAKGLHLLSAQLVTFHTNPNALADGAAVQLELLLAFKSAMNSQLGLEMMTHEADLVSSLALNVDSLDPAICTQTLELLAVLMVSGEGGIKTVLEALDFFKLVKRERVRFQTLVDMLLLPSPPTSRSTHSTHPQIQQGSNNKNNICISLKRDILFFLNTVVNTSLLLEDRLEIRADLIYAGMLPAIEKLKLLCFDELVQDVDVDMSAGEGEGGGVWRRVEELHELESQLQVFETVLQRDAAECLTDLETTFYSAEVDLSEPDQILQALLSSAVEHECFSPLLRTLQALLVIPSYDALGQQQWAQVQRSVQAIVQDAAATSSGIYREQGQEPEIGGGWVAGLAWKQRVEELSQQVRGLASRCHTLEEEDALLREELQELRGREAALQFLREEGASRGQSLGQGQGKELGERSATGPLQGRGTPEGGGIAAAGTRVRVDLGDGMDLDDLSKKISSGAVSKGELQGLESNLEMQQQRLQHIQRLLKEGMGNGTTTPPPSNSPSPSVVPAKNAEEKMAEKGSTVYDTALRAAVTVEWPGGERRAIPLAPPLPREFPLRFAPPPVDVKTLEYGSLCAPPLPSSVSPPGEGAGRGGHDPLSKAGLATKPKKPIIAPNVPMRSLFWSRVPDSSIAGTVWEQLSDAGVTLDLVRLEEQFCKTLLAVTESEEQRSQQDKSEKVAQKDISLLDSKVQQNVGIALAKFRMPTHEICRALLQLDCGPSSRLDLDKLQTLRALAPTPDDLQVLKEYDGDVEKLGKVEKFFLHINDIPRYIPRLDCFIFMKKFQMMASEMYQQFDVMNRALEQVEQSASFRRILEIVLALGNYLNGGTPRGGYYGFKLEGLLKLSTVKSVDNKLTLMHFLVKQCSTYRTNDRLSDGEGEGEGHVLRVCEELSVAEEASRMSLETCQADMSGLRRDLRKVEAAISDQLQDPDPDEEDRLVEVLSPFRREASAEIQRLQEELSSVVRRFDKTVVLFGGAKDQNTTFTVFFSLIKDFLHGFAKAHHDIEKTRVLKEKLERKRIAEEKAKQARREKKIGISDAETLIDDVFFALKGKKADEILDSLKASASSRHRRPKHGSSKRRLAVTGGSHRRRGRGRGGAAEEWLGAGGDEAGDQDALAAMMLKLGVRGGDREEGKLPSPPAPSSISTSTNTNGKGGSSSRNVSSSGSAPPRGTAKLSAAPTAPAKMKPPSSPAPSRTGTKHVPGGAGAAGLPTPSSPRLTPRQQAGGGLEYRVSPRAGAGAGVGARKGGSGSATNSPIARRGGGAVKQKQEQTEDDELLSFLNRKKGGKK